jgi:protein-S-isoprenylcysteine O-methyltransferase Ste14
MGKRGMFKNTLKKLDVFEQVVLSVLFFWFLLRLLPDNYSQSTLYLSLLIISESIVVALLLLRRPTEKISISFNDWFVAFSGTFLPLLISKGGETLMPRLGATLMFWGLFIHVGAKLSLLRSFGVVPADRGIKVKGLYAIIRHPMYAGYFFTHLGFLVSAPTLWNLAVYTCCWILLVSRIFAEERLLLKTSEYKAYIERVPYRLIPGVF